MTHKNESGFTIIELSLSLVGIGVLLLSITLTILNIFTNYNQLLSLKSVAQAGRAIIADIQSEIRSAQVFDPIVQNNDFKAIPNTANPTGGRLCLGTYSYIWNYGDSLSSGDVGKNSYKDSTDKLRFIKISDQNKSFCTNLSSQPLKSSSTEMLNSFDRPLVFYDFKITSPLETNVDNSTGRRAYYIEIVIGTSDPNMINLETNKCKTPDQAGSNVDVCVSKIFSVNILSGGSI